MAMLIDVHSSSEAQQDSALQEICRELGAHQRRAEASLHYTQSAFLQVKRKAINILVELFPHAQDLQEQIINTAYDLAEDQQFEIRQLGYNSVTELSRSAPTLWTARNVDVLVQLLATDDPGDLESIKHAIAQHIGIDAESTLKILCHYVGDQDVNDDLRGTVMAFLSEDPTITHYLRESGSNRSSLYSEEMLLLIPTASLEDTQTIVEQLLLPYPFSSSVFSRLLSCVIEKATNTLSSELASQHDPLELSSFESYLQCVDLVLSKYENLDSTPLLILYSSHNLTHSAFSRIPPESQQYYIGRLADIYRRCAKNKVSTSRDGFVMGRNSITISCAHWTQVLMSSDATFWNSVVPLTRAILLRCQEDYLWHPEEQPLRALLSKVSNKSIPQSRQLQAKEVQAIIKNIFEHIQSNASRNTTSLVVLETSLAQSLAKAGPISPKTNNKRKPEDSNPTDRPPRILSSGRPLALPRSNSTASVASSLLGRLNLQPITPSLALVDGQGILDDETSPGDRTTSQPEATRASKKRKVSPKPSQSQSNPPALLSRLELSSQSEEPNPSSTGRKLESEASTLLNSAISTKGPIRLKGKGIASVKLSSQTAPLTPYLPTPATVKAQRKTTETKKPETKKAPTVKAPRAPGMSIFGRAMQEIRPTQATSESNPRHELRPLVIRKESQRNALLTRIGES